MAKAKMRQGVIPKFSNEAEEAAWWDSHRSEVETQIRQRIKQERPLTLRSLMQGTKPSQPITLRIAKEDLETARQLAAQKGMGYQTYVKMLLREALANAEYGSVDRQLASVPYRFYERFANESGSVRQVRFRSYNPYESIYPGLRVVSRETLHLMKMLRTQGYSVIVEPDDGTKLNYLSEKGFRELLSDPIFAYVIGIPTGLVLNLVANWISQLKRLPKPGETSLVLEFDENGKRVRYTEGGGPVSDEKFKSLLVALETRKRKFEESRRLVSPYPDYRIPIQLEHSGKVVGWSKKPIGNDQEKAILIEAQISDAETQRRINSGELKGFSHAGIASNATCLICESEYVECNHIAGNIYEGVECTVRYTLLPAEISVVKNPIQPLARIRKSKP
jgi:predicted DNA binding CopG/RHH family protein